MLRLAALAHLILCLALAPFVAYAEDGAAQSIELGSGESSETAVPKKRPVTLGFSAYAKGFRLICTLVEKDGRLALFSSHIEYALVELEECAPCKALLRSFGAACKIKPKEQKKEAKAEAAQEAEAAVPDAATETLVAPTVAPTPNVAAKFPPQREPSVELLDAVSQLFIRIANDEKRAPYAAQTLRGLVSLMRDPEELKPGEVEYLDILSEYLLAPFSHMIAEVPPTSDRPEQSEAVPTPAAVDDLF
ncbi:MAG: hypothetical protein K1X79_01295 [Oligoflexia bacterium]|nr:hypothetical protein [Oligoflexia bacterium]